MHGTYNITYGGKQAGKLKVYSEGLKTVFTAETEAIGGVVRLAIVSNGKTIPIGVLTPSGKGLYLKKGFSKNSLREIGIFGIDGVIVLGQEGEQPEEIGWRSVSDPAENFSDPDLKAACKGAQGVLMQKFGDATELAFPVAAGVPFGLMPAFCLGRPVSLGGKDYLIFTIKDGNLSA